MAVLRALGVLLVPVALAGCSRPVEVSLPVSASDPACAAAGARWPATVSGEQPVPVSPQSPAVRAWGAPAVIARCGLPSPGPTTDECLAVDGVDWVVTPLSDGTKFVTYGRSPAIEVLVPRRYAPEPLLLPAFSPAARALPTTERHCS